MSNTQTDRKKGPLSAGEMRGAIERGRLEAGELSRYMRREGVTISELAARMDVSRLRVRQVRGGGVEGALFVRDWLEGLSGLDLLGTAGTSFRPVEAWLR